MESGIVPVVRLPEVFRQAAHSRIVTNAHRINQGLLPELTGPDAGTRISHFIERKSRNGSPIRWWTW